MRRRFPMVGVVLFISAAALAADWPYWRGPDQNGDSGEPAPVTTWSLEGENLVWKSPEGGRSTPIVMNGRVYCIGPVGDGINLQERVFALDSETGKLVWEYRFNVYLTDIVEARVGWSALCGDPATGNVYAHGTGGEFFCFSKDGNLLWKRSLREEFGRVSGYGGRLQTPVVDEDRVVINFLNSGWGPQAKSAHRFVAFDKNTGDVVWWSEPAETPEDTTYAVPITAVVEGKRLLIAPAADGVVYGLEARTGNKVWSRRIARKGLNVGPVIDGKRVYLCHGEENLKGSNMGLIMCADASLTGDVTSNGIIWKKEGLMVGYVTPVLAKDRLYVVTNSAELYCFDANTGDQHWKFDLGKVGKGSPLVTADGVIYVGEQTGIFHILKDEGDKCTSLCHTSFLGPNDAVDEIYGSPAIANGRVYFMTRYGTYCVGPKSPVKSPNAAPPPPGATAADGKQRLLIVPGDLTVHPGETVAFTARLLDADGPGFKPAKAEWSIKGVKGTMSPDGAFKVGPAPPQFAGGIVSAKAEGAEATARLRVSPALPYTEDFESYEVGSTPPGWVGVGRKTEIAERDGSKTLRKLAKKEFPSPPFMRVFAFQGLPIPDGCTVQCDMLGTPRGERFRPDMGITAMRYELTIQGIGKVVRLESWGSIPRLRKEVPFEFTPDKWYTMKVDVAVEEAEAKVRGKVWPRGDPEPAEWTIEVTDPTPNREGAIALYAYSPGTTVKSDGPEVFFDNLKVTPHE